VLSGAALAGAAVAVVVALPPDTPRSFAVIHALGFDSMLRLPRASRNTANRRYNTAAAVF